MKSAAVWMTGLLLQIVPALSIAQSAQSPLPAEREPPTQSSAPNSTPSQAPAAAPAQSVPAAEKKSSASIRKKRRHKVASPGTQKVIVKNGSTPDPAVQFSTAGSKAQASHDRQNTDGLLSTTSTNLQKLSIRQLNRSQEDMKTQINSYMRQAKAAEDTGDFQSAYNLALKANLLSNELVGK